MDYINIGGIAQKQNAVYQKNKLFLQLSHTSYSHMSVCIAYTYITVLRGGQNTEIPKGDGPCSCLNSAQA